MKWLWIAVTGVFVAGLVTLGVLAVDERNVVWEGRAALCPYCRAPLPNLAHACGECRRTVDWSPTSETCTHCLSAEDVQHLRNAFEALATKEEPLPGALAAFPVAYFDAMQPGGCVYCAGLKKVLDGGREKVDCPVCRSDGRCIACGGGRSVVIGDEAGHRRLLERRAVWGRARSSAELTRLAVARARLVDEDVRSLRGFLEAEEQLGDLLLRARDRIAAAFAALHEELAKQRETARAKTG